MVTHLYFCRNLVTPILKNSGPMKSSSILRTEAPLLYEMVSKISVIWSGCSTGWTMG